MGKKYDLYSEFDIQKHKETFVNYLEVLIEKNGHVMYAVPSHQELAIKLACKEKGWTRKELEDACPKEYYFDFLTWLLSLTGAVSVWNDFYVGSPNDAQKQKLHELKYAGIYKGKVCHENVEADIE